MKNLIDKIKEVTSSKRSMIFHVQYYLLPDILKFLFFKPFKLISLNLFEDDNTLNTKKLNEFLKDKNFKNYYFKFILNLDPKSIYVTNTVLGRLIVSKIWYKENELSLKEITDLNTEIKNLIVENGKIYNEEMFLKLIFPGFDHHVSIFKYHCGLALLTKQELEEYINDSDCIDGGSFHLDSAVVFAKLYNFKKIHSFEIDSINFNKGKSILDKNYPEVTNISSNFTGLSNKESQIEITPTGSSVTSFAANKNLKNKSELIKLVTIDDFSNNEKLNIKFIKLDVEGAEYDAILGAKETITKNLPVMSISIYHNFKDFFEIKPLIESFAPNKYNFYVRKIAPFPAPHETMLLCIPKISKINVINLENYEIYG